MNPRMFIAVMTLKDAPLPARRVDSPLVHRQSQASRSIGRKQRDQERFAPPLADLTTAEGNHGSEVRQ
jgi:hypothetical protein